MWVDVTFAERSPPFIPPMQRLRCQAKVNAKTLERARQVVVYAEGLNIMPAADASES